MDPITIAMGLAQFAPVVAGWFGGSKAQEVATKVVGIAQAVTGKNEPNEALAAIRADPNLALQFQTKVLEQQVTLAQLATDEKKAVLIADVAEDQTAATDRASARSMQIARASKWPGILTALLTLCVIGVVSMLLYWDFYKTAATPTPNDPLTMLVIGSLLTQWTASCAYWFGTTRQTHNLQNSLAQSTPSGSVAPPSAPES